MYHIIEIQTNGSSSAIVTPIPSAETKNEAESIFHQKLAYAAISEVPFHSVVLIDDRGIVSMSGTYEHGVA